MKQIIFNENSFKLFKKCLMNEINVPKGVTFCTSPNHELIYKQRLKDLENIPNLRTDKYKNYNLEEAYKEWADVNFSKDSNEYKTWCGILKHYLDYIDRSIDFVKGKIARNGNSSPHWAFIDPNWVKCINSDTEDYQGIYCLTLKIYQNKPMWNDLFFNPIFENLKNGIKEIRKFAMLKRKADKKYDLLLPLEEYIEIGKFMSNENNARPELFYGTSTETDNNEPDFNWEG